MYKYTKLKNRKQYNQDGSGFFSSLRNISKKLVRPAGFKKIRTSTGAFKTFSRGARGKQFTFFGLRNRSSKNIKNRLNFMNERIAGKTQKIEGYAAKLKESQGIAKTRINEYSRRISGKQSRIAELEKLKEAGTLTRMQKRELNIAKSTLKGLKNKHKSIVRSHAKETLKLNKKLGKAQKNLQKKLDTYGPKQKKYQALMKKKIYKSQKRLDKGFTKTCRNLTKKGKSAIGCLEAFEKCKGQGLGLDMKAMTGCINMESSAMGLPIDLKQGDVTGTMTKLANKHFINVFKRRRHLREIARISKHGSDLQKSINTSSKTLAYGKALRTAEGDTIKIGEFSKARTRQLSGQDIIPGSGVKDFSSSNAQKLIRKEANLQKIAIGRQLREGDAKLLSEVENLKASGASPESIKSAENAYLSSIQQTSIARTGYGLNKDLSPEVYKDVFEKQGKWLKRAERVFGKDRVTRYTEKYAPEHLPALEAARKLQSDKDAAKAAAKALATTPEQKIKKAGIDAAKNIDKNRTGIKSLFWSKEAKAAAKAARGDKRKTLTEEHWKKVEEMFARRHAESAKNPPFLSTLGHTEI
jgi:hypothetical protein